jgi:hypothetical protein
VGVAERGDRAHGARDERPLPAAHGDEQAAIRVQDALPGAGAKLGAHAASWMVTARRRTTGRLAKPDAKPDAKPGAKPDAKIEA